MKLVANGTAYLGILLLACLMSGCGQTDDDGLIKHQVTGRVLINGVPQKGIAVCFNHTDPNVTNNAARPVAVTDDDGGFVLSTNGAEDGAVEGDYIVTFFWPLGGTSSRDLLNGKFTSKESSKFNVKISGEDNDLDPFNLAAPPHEVEEALKILASKTPQS